MRCPLCNVTMREVPRRGVKIDICPECRGVWLDGGELEKLLDESERWMEPSYRARERYDDDDDDDHPRSGRRKRKGFLGDIFDFD